MTHVITSWMNMRLFVGLAVAAMMLMGPANAWAQTGGVSKADYVVDPPKAADDSNAHDVVTGQFYYKVRVRVWYTEKKETADYVVEMEPRYEYDPETGVNKLVMKKVRKKIVRTELVRKSKYVTEVRCVTLTLPVDLIDKEGVRGNCDFSEYLEGQQPDLEPIPEKPISSSKTNSPQDYSVVRSTPKAAKPPRDSEPLRRTTSVLATRPPITSNCQSEIGATGKTEYPVSGAAHKRVLPEITDLPMVPVTGLCSE